MVKLKEKRLKEEGKAGGGGGVEADFAQIFRSIHYTGSFLEIDFFVDSEWYIEVQWLHF